VDEDWTMGFRYAMAGRTLWGHVELTDDACASNRMDVLSRYNLIAAEAMHVPSIFNLAAHYFTGIFCRWAQRA
jgi:hypothetical protein